MNFLKDLWAKISWRLWGQRRAVREITKLVKAGPPSRRENGSIYRTIRYSDMNLEHYERMEDQRHLRDVLPPPDADDSGLN